MNQGLSVLPGGSPGLYLCMYLKNILNNSLFLFLLLASADAQDTGNDIKFDKAVFFSAKRYFSVTVIPLAIAAKSNIKGDTKKWNCSIYS